MSNRIQVFRIRAMCSTCEGENVKLAMAHLKSDIEADGPLECEWCGNAIEDPEIKHVGIASSGNKQEPRMADYPQSYPR